MMNMNVGDKLVCKHTNKFHIKNNEYVILKVKDTGWSNTLLITVSSELYSICEIYSIFLFRDYFYTNKELRKNKLDKLGCTSLIITEE